MLFVLHLRATCLQVDCRWHLCRVCFARCHPLASTTCLQVFISEQELYSGRELERHMKGGDVEGPMAAAGFKGHPECR